MIESGILPRLCLSALFLTIRDRGLTTDRYACREFPPRLVKAKNSKFG
jgi:hypothetical protein